MSIMIDDEEKKKRMERARQITNSIVGKDFNSNFNNIALYNLQGKTDEEKEYINRFNRAREITNSINPRENVLAPSISEEERQNSIEDVQPFLDLIDKNNDSNDEQKFNIQENDEYDIGGLTAEQLNATSQPSTARIMQKAQEDLEKKKKEEALKERLKNDTNIDKKTTQNIESTVTTNNISDSSKISSLGIAGIKDLSNVKNVNEATMTDVKEMQEANRKNENIRKGGVDAFNEWADTVLNNIHSGYAMKPIAGLVSIGTTVAGLGLKGLEGTAEIFGFTETANKLNEAYNKTIDVGSRIKKKADYMSDVTSQIDSKFVKTSGQVADVISNMLGNSTIGYVTGISGTVAQGLSVGGSSAQEVLDENKDNIGKATITGIAKGYVSYLTERMFDANILTRGSRKTSIQEGINRLIANKINSDFGKKFTNKFVGIVGENLEELAEDNAGYLIDKLVNNKDLPGFQEWWNNTTETAKTTTLSTIIMSLLGLGGESFEDIEKDMETEYWIDKAKNIIEQEDLAIHFNTGQTKSISNMQDFYVTQLNQNGEINNIITTKGKEINNPNTDLNITPVVVKDSKTDYYNVIDGNTGVVLDSTYYSNITEAENSFNEKVNNLSDFQLRDINNKINKANYMITDSIINTIATAKDLIVKNEIQENTKNVSSFEKFNDIKDLTNQISNNSIYNQASAIDIFNMVDKNIKNVHVIEQNGISYINSLDKEGNIAYQQKVNNPIYSGAKIKTIINNAVQNADLSDINTFENRKSINATPNASKSNLNDFNISTANFTDNDIKKITEPFMSKRSYNKKEVSDIWNEINAKDLDVKFDKNENIENYVAIEDNGDNLLVNLYDNTDTVVKSEKVSDKNGRFFTKDIKNAINTIMSNTNQNTTIKNQSNNNIAQTLEQDIKNFSRQVDGVLNGTFPKRSMLTLLSKTPQPLIDIGLNDLPITMTQRHLNTIVNESGSDKNANYHGLGIETVKQLPEAINNPLNIVESSTKNDSVVLTTYLADNQERTIVASIKIDGNGLVNKILIDTNVMTSAYGRNNYEAWMDKNLKEGRLLYDVDRGVIKKVDVARLQLPRSTNSKQATGTRLQLPGNSNSATDISSSNSNNSITQLTNSVKSKNTAISNKSMQNDKNNTLKKQNGGLTKSSNIDKNHTFDTHIQRYKQASKKQNKINGNVVEINTNIFDGVSKKKQSQLLNEYLKNEVKGHDYIVGLKKIIANKFTIGKLSHGVTNFDSRIPKSIRTELKANIIGNLDNILKNSYLYQANLPDSKNHSFADTFDRMKSNFRYEGQNYSVMLEIGKKDGRNTLYSIENIKKISNSLSKDTKVSKLPIKGYDPTVPKFSIAKNEQNVKLSENLTAKNTSLYAKKTLNNKKEPATLTNNQKTSSSTSKTRGNLGSNNSIIQNNNNIKFNTDTGDNIRYLKKTGNSNQVSPKNNEEIRFTKRTAKKTGELDKSKINAEREGAYIEQEIQKIEKTGNWDNSIPVTRMTDIRKTIEDYLGLGIKKGHFRENAYAIYKGNRDVIRTKELKDIDSILHETGHALDIGKRINLDKESIADELLNAVNKYGGYETEIRSIKLEEGFAEVIREYSIVPDQAKVDYPQTAAIIEQIRQKDASFDKFITTIQEQTYNYIHQNPKNRTLSNMSIGEQTDKRVLSKAWIEQEAMRNIYDKDYALKSAVKELAKVNDKTINDVKASENAYYLVRLSNGIGQKVSSMLSNGYIDENGNKLMPGLNQIGEILGNDAQRFNDLRAYLVAQRDIEYKAKKLKTGIRTIDSEAVVRQFKNDAQIQEASSIIYDTLNGVMQYAVDNGLISQETVNNLKSSNAFYVPMQRVLENRGNQVGKRGAVADVIKSRTGSELDVKDVLENIISNSSNIIQQVENNNILRALFKQGEESKLTGVIYDVIPTPMIKTGTAQLSLWESELKKQNIDTKKLDLEKTIDLFAPNNKTDTKNLITSFINEEGKRVYLQFNDELIFNSIMNMDKKFMSQVLSINSKMNMPLRYGATMANLGFAIPNMISDTAQASIYSTAGFIPVIDNALGVMDILTATNATVKNFVSKVAPDYANRINALYTIYEQSGATSSTRLSQYRKSTQEIMKEVYGTNKSETLGIEEKFKPLKRLLDLMTYIPEISEQSTRFEVFKKNYDYYKTKGNSETDARIKAALESRDATQDFGRTGNITREINQLIPFSAARVGSIYTFAEKVSANPKQVGMRIAILTAIALGIKTLGYDDKEIQELNQRKKDDNFVLKTGNNVVTIKKPQGILRSMVNLAEYIQDLFTGHIEKGKEEERLKDWLNNAIMDNMPADSVTGLVPNIVAPLIENAINKDFYYNIDIVKSHDLDLPEAEQYYEYNSQLAILLGKVFNYSPAKIDNLISGYFAGLGISVTGIMDYISGKLGLSAEKAEMGTESNTIGKRFIVNVNSNSTSLDEIYNRKTELTKLKNGGTITEEETGELEILTKSIKNISEINKQIKSIKSDTKTSGKEKGEKIKELQAQRTDIARQALGKDLIDNSNKSKIELMEFYPSTNSLSKNNYTLNLTGNQKQEYAKLAEEYYSKYSKQGLYSEEKLKDIREKAKDYAKNTLFQKYRSSLTRKSTK